MNISVYIKESGIKMLPHKINKKKKGKTFGCMKQYLISDLNMLKCSWLRPVAIPHKNQFQLQNTAIGD